VTAASEHRTGHRNRALAYLMADFGNMVNQVEDTLDHYFRQCSVTISCEELARAGLLLARHGLRADGSRLLSQRDARRIIAIMLTCGTYDAAGEVAYRIGLPCKSGVGGGILAIIPDRCAAVAWGPGLDEHGNSVSAAAAMDTFGKSTGWTIF
jgi:glutaminase